MEGEVLCEVLALVVSTKKVYSVRIIYLETVEVDDTLDEVKGEKMTLSENECSPHWE